MTLYDTLLLVGAALFVIMCSATTDIEDAIQKLATENLRAWKYISVENVKVLMNRSRACEDFQCFSYNSRGFGFCNEQYCNRPPTDDKLNRMVRKHIQRVMQSCRITSKRSFTFVVNIRDEPVQLRRDFNINGFRKEAPLFSFQTSHQHLDVPIDYSRDHFDQKLELFVQRLNEISNSSADIPWEERIPILLWRGSQTGGWYTVNNWKDFARSKLVLLSKEAPDKIDAAFNTWTQVFPRARRVMNKAVGLGNTVPLEQHGRWKYLASLDGNGWASRLPFLLALGSLVFKQESDYFTWWYPLLKPYQHFAPVVINSTHQNIFESIEWAKRNDDSARKIAGRGRQFVLQYLIKYADVYMCKLLSEYSVLYNGSKYSSGS